MKKQNVAVVGGAGFLGSHLVDYLIECKNNVLVLDNLIAGRKEFINPEARFLWCDITHSEAELRKIFTQYDIDYVFNYAAIPYVPVSYERPLHTFDINARGALMVMNAAQECGVKGILQVSSAEIYGDASGRIDEQWPAHPHSTYGASKLAIDTMVQTRFKESCCPAIALRQFNCVGERDVLHPYVIPEIYKQLCKDDLVWLGNNSFRDFMYARDAVRMAVELLEKGKYGEVYNLGSEEGIKIYDLARLMGILMRKEIFVEEDDTRKRRWEVWHLQSDNTKIYSTIEARPQISLEDALRRTIAYYDREETTWAF
jgi:UDP-glucose 4-epimerase